MKILECRFVIWLLLLRLWRQRLSYLRLITPPTGLMRGWFISFLVHWIDVLRCFLVFKVSLCSRGHSSTDILWANYFLSTCSGFKDLFDWQHFIETLKDDIHIVETLPPEYTGIEPFNKTPISWSKVNINPYIIYNKHLPLILWEEHKIEPSLGMGCYALFAHSSLCVHWFMPVRHTWSLISLLDYRCTISMRISGCTYM